MRSNPCDIALTELLFEASLVQLRATMETLPIGTLQLTAAGVIASIDDWTEKSLGYSHNELRGSSITFIIEAGGFEIIKAISSLKCSECITLVLRTRAGMTMTVSALILREPAWTGNPLTFVFTKIVDADVFTQELDTVAETLQHARVASTIQLDQTLTESQTMGKPDDSSDQFDSSQDAPNQVSDPEY